SRLPGSAPRAGKPRGLTETNKKKMEGCEREKPRFAVWRRSMNLLKQVEPLKKAALQASSLQRHAHHAASRLTWVNIGSTSLPPSRTKQGTQTLRAILVLARDAVKTK